MKNMKKMWALLLALVLTLSLAACGGGEEAPAPEEDEEPAPQEETIVYAVEAGSAGEEVALESGYQVNSVLSQADALMEVQSGTSDAAIIDSLMAGAMIGEGTSYPELKAGDRLTEEFYGVGCRKGSDLASFINAFFSEIAWDENNTLTTLAETYGVNVALVEQEADIQFEAAAEDSDVAYIQDKGTLVVGMTEFAPMDYKDENGEWIGFDADLAKLVAEKLGVEVEFMVLDWDNKLLELDSKNVDVLWNGMTLTQAALDSMTCTNAYCVNAQMVVTK